MDAIEAGGRGGNNTSSHHDVVKHAVYELVEGPEDGLEFPSRLASVGDTDGDGCDDLLLTNESGYPENHTLPLDNHLLKGRTDQDFNVSRLVAMENMWPIFDNRNERNLGDLNRDGLGDFGAPPWTWDGRDERSDSPETLQVWYGRDGGVASSPDQVLQIKPDEVDSEDWKGFVYAGIGTIDYDVGNDFDDILTVGKWRRTAGDEYRVELRIYNGSATGLPSSPSWNVTLSGDRAEYWSSVREIHHTNIWKGHKASVILFLDDPLMGQGARVTVHLNDDDRMPLDPDLNLSLGYDKYNFSLRTTRIHAPVEVPGGQWGEQDLVVEQIFHPIGELENSLPDPDGVQYSRVKLWKGRDGIDPWPDMNETLSFPRDTRLAVFNLDGDYHDDFVFITSVVPTIFHIPEMKPPSRVSITITMMEQWANQELYEWPRWQWKVTDLIGGHVTGIDWGDFDGDGELDLVLGIEGTTEWSMLRDYYTRIYPGKLLFLFGSGVQDKLQEVVVPDTNPLYAEHKAYVFKVHASERGMLQWTLYVEVVLDAFNTNVTLLWENEDLENPFSVKHDPGGYVRLESTADDVETDPVTNLTWLYFRVVFTWKWPHENPCNVSYENRQPSGGVSYRWWPDQFSVENDLDFHGEMVALDEGMEPIGEEDWIAGGDNITITGPAVVYEGTTDLHPLGGTATLVLEDDGGNTVRAPLPHDGLVNLTFQVENRTDIEETFTLDIEGLPAGAEILTRPTAIIRVDGKLPEFDHVFPDEEGWWGYSPIEASIRATDDASGVDITSFQYAVSTDGNGSYGPWMSPRTESNPVSNIIWAYALLDLPDGDDNFVKWRVKDLVGNGYLFSEDIRVPVETENVTYTDNYPDEDSWQGNRTVECGVTITDGNGVGINVSSIGWRTWEGRLDDRVIWNDYFEGDTVDAPTVTTRFSKDLEESPDNHIQWRARPVGSAEHVISRPFRIMVGCSNLSFRDFEPWGIQTAQDINVSVVIDEPSGKGLDLSSLNVRYRVGEGSHTDWSMAEGAPMDGSYVAWAILSGLRQGDNYVQFMGTNVGNPYPSISHEHHIVVDRQGPVIHSIHPLPDDIQNETEVTVTVHFDDESGVNRTRVWYRFGTAGETSLGEWELMNVQGLADGYEGTTVLDLVRGRSNFVQIRYQDRVGNENISDVVSIWVNRDPVANIARPADDEEYSSEGIVKLSANGSSDPDGEPLIYLWYIDGADEPVAFLEEAEIELGPGEYRVVLIVRDGHGGEDRHSVQFSIDDGGLSVSEAVGSMVILLVLLALLISVVVIYRRRARTKAWRTHESPPRNEGKRE